MPRQHINHQSTADMGRPPGGTPAQFFCTVTLRVLCVCLCCACVMCGLLAVRLQAHHRMQLPPTPPPKCELALFRRANFVHSRTILHQLPQPLVPISQHLAFWHRLHLAASRTDLCHSISCRSCSISCYILAPCLAPISAASRINLAAFGTDLAASCGTVPISHDLAQTFHHLHRSRGTM